MIPTARPAALAGSELTNVRHVCALFHSDEEEYRVLLPFIREGLECGERAVHVVGPDEHAEHLRRLSSVGIDTSGAEQCGQLDLRSSTDTYLRDGRFDPDRMVELFSELAGGDGEQGIPLSRFVCRMHWAADGRTNVDDLIEFESRVNQVWRCNQHTVVCTYHLDQFSGDAVIDLVRTHPFVIIGGVLRQNPFFEPPEQFLPELRARRRAATVRRVDM